MLSRSHLLFALVLAMVAGEVQAFGLADTTTTLTVTSGGSPAVEINSGTTITLTARVNAANVDVTRGTVTFCDTTVAPCTDIHVVATAQLTSAGTAIVKFVPGVGNHLYTADFLGTSSYKKSQAAAKPLNVERMGVIPTTTSMTASGGVGGYDLTATVTGFSTTPRLPALSGTVTFATVPGGTPLAMADLAAPSVPALSFLNSSNAAVPGGAVSVAVGDFNGDGKADLVVVGNATATVLLGNGDGTFTPAPSLNFSCVESCGIAIVADFNGDGIPDLAVGFQIYTGPPFLGGLNIFLGKGDGTFTELPETVNLEGVNGEDLAWTWVVGDFNGDGIPDLAAGGKYYGCWISLGKGDGTFTPPTESSACDVAATSLAVGDFNGDGITDLALTGNVFEDSYSDVELLLGKGDGTFMQAPTGPWMPNNTPFLDNAALVAGDFNGDGLLDLAVAQTSNADDIVILLGQTGGGFTQGVTIPAEVRLGQVLPTGGLSLGDFNGDGIADLVVIGEDISNNVQILLGKGDGTFVNAPGSPFTLGSGGEALAVGNFDGGDLTDLAVGAQAWLTFLSETSVTTATRVSVRGRSPLVVDASYLGDTEYGPSTSTTYALEPSPSASTKTTLAVTLGGTPVTAVDTNDAIALTATVTSDWEAQGVPPAGDCQTHGAPLCGPVTGSVSFCDSLLGAGCQGAALLGSAQLTSDGTAAISIHLGPGAHVLTAVYAGTDTYAFSVSASAPLRQNRLAEVRFTSVGLSLFFGDFFLYSTLLGLLPPGLTPMASPSPTGTVTFIDLSASNAVLASGNVSDSSTAGEFLTAEREGADPRVGVHPDSVAVGDFNGDGTPDLAIANYGSNSVSILLGNGNGYGTFATQVSYPVGSGPVWVVTGDFNGDGKLDLAVANSNGVLSILLGNGNGTFQPQKTMQVDTSLATLAVGDLNHDGKLDLIAVNSDSPALWALLGTGDGSFRKVSVWQRAHSLGAAAIGDVNGDGVPDVAVTDPAGSTVLLLLGNGDGTFRDPKYLPTGNRPKAVALADVNHDGKNDLVVANFRDNTVSVLLGNGDGTFQFQLVSATAPSPSTIALGDFNSDGIPDLAVTSSTDRGYLTILQGNGNGTFQSSQIYTVGSDPSALAVADLNGDSKPDVAVIDYGDSSSPGQVSILWNTWGFVSEGDPYWLPNFTGTHEVQAIYSGDAIYQGAHSSVFPVTIPAVTTP